MPMDPFFSSANKKYYVENPEFTKLKAEVEAMTEEARDAWCQGISRDPHSPWVARLVLKDLRWRQSKRASVRRRWVAERIAQSLTEGCALHGCVVLHGQSNTGNKCGSKQDHASKTWINRQGPRNTFSHIYDKGRRVPKS